MPRSQKPVWSPYAGGCERGHSGPACARRGSGSEESPVVGALVPTLSLTTMRRHAAAQGFRIWKVRKNAVSYWEYGPYTLTYVGMNAVELRGVGVEELAAFLKRPVQLEQTLQEEVPLASRSAVLC